MTVAPAVAIDMGKGWGDMSINADSTPVIHNTDPGSNAGIPGLSPLCGYGAPRPTHRS
jgi:hypothetical protein